MDYNANNKIGLYYYVNFQSSINSVTLTGMQIEINHYSGDLNSVKVSILVISNEYKFASQMVGYEGTYTFSNSYNVTYTTTLSTPNFQFYRYLTGIFIKSYYNTWWYLGYTFGNNTFSNSPVTLSTKVNDQGPTQIENNFTFKILFVNTNSLPVSSVTLYQIDYNTSNSMTTYTSLTTYSQFSLILVGLKTFTFIPNESNSNDGFQWSASFTNPLLSVTLDDQFRLFKYYALVINHVFPTSPYYLCRNASYPFKRLDLPVILFPTWKCQDYICAGPCNPICASCYSATHCKQCFTGYNLQLDGRCLINPSYYLFMLPAFNATTCVSTLTGCETCSSRGEWCLSCKSDFYETSLGLQNYNIIDAYGTNTPVSKIAVNCTACTYILNCISCNSTVCFACQSTY